MYFDGRHDSRSRHLKAFAQDVIKKLLGVISALKHLEVCPLLMWFLCRYFVSVPKFLIVFGIFY